MDRSFIEKLTQIKTSHNSKDFTTLESELKAYKDIIPEFFSKHGEAPGIRSLYEKVNDNEYGNRTIKSIDLNVTESVYDDYLNGMYTFVSDLNTALITESDVNTYSDKLGVARENDNKFIESIFGGDLNPEEESTVREATDNLEILINFIPKIDTFYNKSVVLSEALKNDNELINSSMEMICESVSNYTYNIIKNVMDTYYKIMESFEDKDDAPVDPAFVLY